MPTNHAIPIFPIWGLYDNSLFFFTCMRIHQLNQLLCSYAKLAQVSLPIQRSYMQVQCACVCVYVYVYIVYVSKQSCFIYMHVYVYRLAAKSNGYN